MHHVAKSSRTLCARQLAGTSVLSELKILSHCTGKPCRAVGGRLGKKGSASGRGHFGSPKPTGDRAAGGWRLPRASLQLCLPPVQKQNRHSISQDTLTALFLQMLPPLPRTVWGRVSCFRAVRVLPAATCFGCSPSCTHLWEAGLQRAPLLPSALEL